MAASLAEFFSARRAALGFGRTREAWPRLLLVFVAFGTIATPIYLLAGLGRWAPSLTATPRDALLVVGLLFLPSLPEELLWRWLLIPPAAFDTAGKAAPVVIGTSAVYTAAHPLAAWWFVPHAWPVFSHPAFLAIVFLLGTTCGAAYILSRSLWPPVIIHWLAVLAWKFLLGGPFILLGR
ncbi:MAG: CPBP family glutamic-type intramembrane protease [Planctomycetota bacterium]